MNDLSSAVLPLLGVGGLTGFAALVLRAFLVAVKATVEINEEKNRTIDRLQGLVDRKNMTLEERDREIDRLQLELVDARREIGLRDLTIERLRGSQERGTGTA